MGDEKERIKILNVVLRVLWFGPLHPETSESTPREALREVHDPKIF